MDTYRVIGLMSGSSLDGLDIAYCELKCDAGKWQYNIIKTYIVEYPEVLLKSLKGLTGADGKSLWQMHTALGAYIGQHVNLFVEQHQLHGKVDFIASHGHTVFHFPGNRFTTQIGDGTAIAAHAGLPVVCDFRSADIAYGGQGTPIVPIGDKLLFSDYKLCLNIGGIANISCKVDEGKIVAFDICAANQVLNYYANRLGKDYDDSGAMAKSGKVNKALLEELNALDYYSQPYPKSLDNSYSRDMVLPVIEGYTISEEDCLATFTEHIALQIAQHINAIAAKQKVKFTAADAMLVTGGGAFNKYLIERIQAHTPVKVTVPDTQTVKFKEALVIALMGTLRMRGEVNVLKSVTGAAKDTVGGAIYN